MITATSPDYNDMVHTKDEEIVFNGTPGSLSTKVTLYNKADEKLFVKNIPLIENADVSAITRSEKIKALRVNTLLGPKEESVRTVYFEIHPQTPPGIYQTEAIIGAVTK